MAQLPYGDTPGSVNAGQQSGFVSLFSIIIIGAVALSVSLAMLTVATFSAKGALAHAHSRQAIISANACADEALERILNNPVFVGNGALSGSGWSCVYAVSDTGGTTRSIALTATVGTVTGKIKLIIDKIRPSIHVVSWQEVADF